MKTYSCNNRLAKKTYMFALAFLMPAAIYVVCLAQNGIWYNSDITPLTYDLMSQHAPSIASVRYLFGDNSLFFNWACDFGGDYFSLFAYMLSSPLNLITVFWGLDTFPNAIYILLVLKVGLMGLSFFVYLRYTYSHKKEQWIDLVFCCCYALMSYTFTYGISIMWLDSMIVFPLCLIPLKKVVEKRRSFCYVFFLTFLIYVNFYLAFPIGIYIFFYYVYLIRKNTRNSINDIIKQMFSFIRQSLLAVALSMPLVFPVIVRLINNILEGSIFGETSISPDNSRSFFRTLKIFFPQQYTSVVDGKYPTIYCGSAILFLVLIFFFYKRSKDCLKQLWLIIPVLLGFLFRGINLVWHGFQEPHGFPYRYAFLFSFGMINIAYLGYRKIEDGIKHKCLIRVICCYALCELVINGATMVAEIETEVGYVSKEEYAVVYENYSALKSITSDDDSQFVRVGEENGKSFSNTSLMFDLAGTTYFSSTYNRSLGDFLISLGSDSTQRVINTSGTNPVAKAFLGVRYILSSQTLGYPYILKNTVCHQNSNSYIYENLSALPICFAVNMNSDYEMLNDPNIHPYRRNEILSQCIFGKNVFQPLSSYCDAIDNSIRIEINKSDLLNNQLFLYFDMMEYENGTDYSSAIYVNGELVRDYKYGIKSKNCSFSIPNYIENDVITILIDNVNTKYLNVSVLYQINYELMSSSLDILHQNGISNLEMRKNGFAGIVDTDEQKEVIITVPYEKGFHVFVDNKEQKTDKYLDTFLSFEVEPGIHSVELIYIPYGLYLGLFMGGIALLITMTIIFKHWFNNRSIIKRAEVMRSE